MITNIDADVNHAFDVRPAIVRNVSGWGTSPIGPTKQPSGTSTTMASPANLAKLFQVSFEYRTLTTTELSKQDNGPFEDSVMVAEPVQDEVRKAQEGRVLLLARKYELGRVSPEESARLQILTERLRRLDPAITAGDWERAIDVAEDIRAQSAELEAFAVEYGLK